MRHETNHSFFEVLYTKKACVVVTFLKVYFLTDKGAQNLLAGMGSCWWTVLAPVAVNGAAAPACVTPTLAI